MAQQTSNAFSFESEAEQARSDSRKMIWTDALINLSTSKAIDLIKNQASTKPELTDLVKKVLQSGEATDLFELLESYFGEEQITSDASILDSAQDNDFSRLLESRRSERSVAKREGISKNISVCAKFIAAGYAELIIRKAWNKPYNAVNASELDESDQEAIKNKIASLRSKKSRLNKLASYDKMYKIQLQAVNAEIDRLQRLLPSSGRVSSTSALKSIDVDQLRTLLSTIKLDELPEEERAKYAELLTKLG